MTQPYGLKIVDHTEQCPYLGDRQATMPFYLPLHQMTPEALDRAMADGVRRSGVFLYHTQCNSCRACVPIRIPIDRFTPRRRHRRVLAKTGQQIRVETGPLVTDETRVALYNRHKIERDLGQPGSEVDTDAMHEFLGTTCCHSEELRLLLEDRLVGISIFDQGATAMSAVYCYFDPSLPHLSLGTFAILQQIELCRHRGLKHLYLGFHVAENDHMRYKASFLPHEKKVDGRWVEFVE